MKNELPVKYIVDINPNKQGKYVAGIGNQIVSPEFLREIQPENVIITNPLYEKEIATTLKQLGIHANIINT